MVSTMMLGHKREWVFFGFPNFKDTGCSEFRNKYFSPFLLEIPEFLAQFASSQTKVPIHEIYKAFNHENLPFLHCARCFLSQWSIYDCMTSMKECVIYVSGLWVFITQSST